MNIEGGREVAIFCLVTLYLIRRAFPQVVIQVNLPPKHTRNVAYLSWDFHNFASRVVAGAPRGKDGRVLLPEPLSND